MYYGYFFLNFQGYLYLKIVYVKQRLSINYLLFVYFLEIILEIILSGVKKLH